jgi:carboxymethylenebutenolidase
MSNAGNEKAMVATWEQHLAAEFGMKDVDKAVATMTEDAHVNLVPLLNGAVGREAVREFYKNILCAQLPPDLEVIPITRTVGVDRIVDECIMRFTHTIQLDWVLPGIPPTGKRIEIPYVTIIQFSGDKMVFERVYWDQGTVMLQAGIIDSSLPVRGAESAVQAANPTLPMNELIRRKR